MGMSSDFLGQIGAMRQQENQINSQRRDSLDRVNETMSSLPSINCCFIFMEAYGGFYKIPWFVRRSRDLHYTPSVRLGYVRMSRLLVPLMRRFSSIRNLVNKLMIEPLTKHAGYLYGENKDGVSCTPYKNFWLKTWDVLGSF